MGSPTSPSVRQWEREVIGERGRGAMAELKPQGTRYCYVRFDDHPDVRELIKYIQAQRAPGVSSNLSLPPIQGVGQMGKAAVLTKVRQLTRCQRGVQQDVVYIKMPYGLRNRMPIIPMRSRYESQAC